MFLFGLGFLPVFPIPHDNNGRLSFQGAPVLTDTAADAKVLHNPGPFYDNRPVGSLNGHIVKHDGFFRCRAMLFANHAILRPDEGDAPVPINDRRADANVLLCHFVQISDGPCGTDLSAKGARELAITDAGHEARGPHRLHPRLKKGRLQAVGQANPHTFAAPQAKTGKTVLADSPRRADHPGWEGIRTGRLPNSEGKEQPSARRPEKSPPGKGKNRANF